MSLGSVQSPSFKGVYRVTMPNVKEIQDPKEKSAVEDAVINSVVMGANMSIAEPRVSKDHASIYYKIDDKNDKSFENGFKSILDDCNKRFNTDLAKKVYFQKVDDKEYQDAEVLK